MELNGELEGIGLEPLLGFLEGLRASGKLTLQDGQWAGLLTLAEGHVVGASFGDEEGLSAVDAIFLALPRCRFAFSNTGEACEVKLVLEPGALRQHLEVLAHEATRLWAAVPSLESVPRVLYLMDGGADGDQQVIGIGRRSIDLFLALKGSSSVATLARQRGLLPTLRQLAELSELGLVEISQSHEPAMSEPEPVRTPGESGPELPAWDAAQRRRALAREQQSADRAAARAPRSGAQSANGHRAFWR